MSINETKEQKVVDIGIIDANQLNDFEMVDIEQLAGNIRVCGLTTPLTVKGPDQNGRYTLISGERRYTALKQLIDEGHTHFKKVPVYIYPIEITPAFEELLIRSSNVENRSLNIDSERLKLVKAVKEVLKENNGGVDVHPKEIVKELESYMGCTDRYRRMYRDISESGNKDIEQMIVNNVATVAEAARIANMEEDKQKEAIEAINKGVKAKDAINAISKGNSTINKPIDISEIENADVDDLVDQFNDFDFTSGVNATIDPSNTLGALNREERSSYSEAEDASSNMVIKWCENMMKRKSYSDSEEAAIEACRNLIDHIDGTDSGYDGFSDDDDYL